MPQQDSRYPEIRIPTLGGLNERPSPANLKPGEFDVLEGFYPARIGLLRRIPGKTLLASVSGKVLQIRPTFNVNGDILIQTDEALYAFTLDELLSRASTPSLTFNPIAEEETMSMAIIVQRESNTVNGGSALGQQSGTDSTSNANTFYGRRLTDMLVNESSTVTTFTQSTGGGAAASTEGQFILSPGDYRISIQAIYNLNASTSVDYGIFGLYNVTSSAFEVYSGLPTDPVISMPMAAMGTNAVYTLEAKITVASSNKTYAIRHQFASSIARTTILCGKPQTASATVAGAAPKQTYCFIKILKTA